MKSRIVYQKDNALYQTLEFQGQTCKLFKIPPLNNQIWYQYADRSMRVVKLVRFINFCLNYHTYGL